VRHGATFNLAPANPPPANPPSPRWWSYPGIGPRDAGRTSAAPHAPPAAPATPLPPPQACQTQGALPDSLCSMSVSPATTVANPLRHQRRPAWLPPISGTPQNPRDLTIRLTLQGRDVREILDAVKIVAPRPPRLCIGDRPAFGFVHGALPASERACHSGSGRQDAVHTVSTGHRRRQ
jgi:hypothetical protein